MKVSRFFIICLVFMIVLGVKFSAHALLEDNGDGTVTQTRNDGSKLMWLKDANTDGTPMTWADAIAWIDSLNSINYLGYNDWRLPVNSPVNGSSYLNVGRYDGSSDIGYNISAPGSAYPGSTASEMAYMFYTELGNLSYYDTSAGWPQPGWGLSNSGPFTNLQPDYYWGGTEYANPAAAYSFCFYHDTKPGRTGCQNNIGKILLGNAWAVCDVEPVYLLAEFINEKTKVEYKLGRNDEIEDKLEIKWYFKLGEDSDGIDLLTENVKFTVGDINLTIPAGSFQFDNEYVLTDTCNVFANLYTAGTCDERKNNVKIKEENGYYKFEVKIDKCGLPEVGTVNPLHIELLIGNDKGEADLYLSEDHGKVEFRGQKP